MPRISRSSPSVGNQVETTSPTGAWLAKVLRPFTFQPSSTRTAVPVGKAPSVPPVETTTMASLATRLSIGSTAVRPCRQRWTLVATTWRCIEEASAVEPQWRPSSA